MAAYRARLVGLWLPIVSAAGLILPLVGAPALAVVSGAAMLGVNVALARAILPGHVFAARVLRRRWPAAAPATSA